MRCVDEVRSVSKAESESDWPGCRSPPRPEYLKRTLSHPDCLWGGNASSCSRSLIRSWSPHPCTQVIWILCSQSRGIWTFSWNKKKKKKIAKTTQWGCYTPVRGTEVQRKKNSADLTHNSMFSKPNQVFLVLKCNQTACVLHDWGPVRLLLVRCSSRVVYVNGYMTFEELQAIRWSLFCINF